MPICKCGVEYQVIGEDDGLCPSCMFDQLVADGDVMIFTMDQVANGELEGRLN